MTTFCCTLIDVHVYQLYHASRSAASLASLELYNAAFDAATSGSWREAHDLLVPAVILQFAPLIDDAWNHGPLVTGTTLHISVAPHMQQTTTTLKHRNGGAALQPGPPRRY